MTCAVGGTLVAPAARVACYSAVDVASGRLTTFASARGAERVERHGALRLSAGQQTHLPVELARPERPEETRKTQRIQLQVAHFMQI
eukprot:6196122-Pleurochrysis_carterae.AAC.5